MELCVCDREGDGSLARFMELCVCARLEGDGSLARFMELCVCDREGDKILAMYY